MTTTDQLSRESLQAGPLPQPGLLGKLGYAAMLLAVAALAATGLGTFFLGKAPMTHWVLMAHASAAPLFAIGLAVVALTWADRNRFGCSTTCGCAGAKGMFWIILVSGLVVILSGVVPMTPIFGTHGQHALYYTHRYSAIVLSLATALHLLSLRRKA